MTRMRLAADFYLIQPAEMDLHACNPGESVIRVVGISLK